MLAFVSKRTAVRCGSSIPRLHVIRSFMSTQAVTFPAEDESNMILILGKPGGGKGTISGKILKVRNAFSSCDGKTLKRIVTLLSRQAMLLKPHFFLACRTFRNSTTYRLEIFFGSMFAKRRNWGRKPKRSWMLESLSPTSL